MDPTDGTDAVADNDGDGISNGDEVKEGTNPSRADSDGDGISVDEIAAGTNPVNADSDGDGQSDGAETVAGTNPNSASDTFVDAQRWVKRYV